MSDLFNPDDVLAQLLRAIEDWENSPAFSPAEHEAAERATSAAFTLHDWLSKGGRLPVRWEPAAYLQLARNQEEQ